MGRETASCSTFRARREISRHQPADTPLSSKRARKCAPHLRDAPPFSSPALVPARPATFRGNPPPPGWHATSGGHRRCVDTGSAGRGIGFTVHAPPPPQRSAPIGCFTSPTCSAASTCGLPIPAGGTHSPAPGTAATPLLRPWLISTPIVDCLSLVNSLTWENRASLPLTPDKHRCRG